jgi:hypothetical protein
MTVARILAAKGKDVVTTQPHRTLAEAAEILMARNWRGCRFERLRRWNFVGARYRSCDRQRRRGGAAALKQTGAPVETGKE